MRRQDVARLRHQDRSRQPPLWPPADFVDVAQVTVYARALGVALAQKAYDSGESHERAALQELLATMVLEGVLIQAGALHTTQAFFGGASPRGPTSS